MMRLGNSVQADGHSKNDQECARKCDCLPRRSEQRDWLSGSSCLGEEVEGISEELIAGEED